jgi:thiol-disulfide isomerase/thioredoxin
MSLFFRAATFHGVLQMNEKISKQIELCANIGIILLTLMGGYVLIRGYFSNTMTVTEGRAVTATTKRVPTPGMKVSVPGVNWEDKDRTLLFVLSSSCKYCKESTPFYQRLVKETQKIKDLRLVALLPQEVEQGEKYLSDMGIAIREVKQSGPGSVGASGYPTLVIVDNTGTIKKAWVGKLSPEREEEVLDQMKCANCS